MNEHTQQLNYQAQIKEYELGIEQMKSQHARIQQEERRKTLEEEAKIQKHRVDYQDMLARKRQEDQLAQQVLCMSFYLFYRLACTKKL